MAKGPVTEDVRAIKAIIDRQFRSLEWSKDRDGDWATFARDFLPDAVLYPSARPLRRQTVEGFLERMQGLAHGPAARIQGTRWVLRSSSSAISP